MAPIQPAAKRFRHHKLGAAVHAILWCDWDPIGVNGMFDRLVEIDPQTGAEIGPAPPKVRGQSWPDDEYDSYVWGVLSILDEGGDAQRVADYLERVETESIGVTIADEKARTSHLLSLGKRLTALRGKG